MPGELNIFNEEIRAVASETGSGSLLSWSLVISRRLTAASYPVGSSGDPPVTYRSFD